MLRRKTLFNVTIFNKEIQVRDHYCQLDNNEPANVEEPYINVYVNITNICNAKCKFCSNEHNRENVTAFNFEKFKNALTEINDKINIHKVSFTGGEPTICIETLKKCLKFTKELNPNIFTVINTNGYRLNELIDVLDYINSIALSRHYYDDDINRQIFGLTKVPDETTIYRFPDKSKLHLSCNLIKDYICNSEEVVKYLEWASKIGCLDVGFVSLMPANEYCKERFVDFNELSFENIQDVFVTKNWNYENLCRCRNYVYIANNAEIIEVYSRYYKNPSYSGNALVFDGQNIRLGFNGEVLF